MRLLRSILTYLALCLCLAAAPAQAITLDWDAVAWPAGSLNNSFDIDPFRAGNDVTVAVTGTTNRLQNIIGTTVATPAISRTFDGGLTPGQNSLHLALDLGNHNQAVTITMSFSNAYTFGVSGVSFTIFDIDKQTATNSNFEDQIRGIYATLTNGTQIAATITNIGSSVRGRVYAHSPSPC
jgi:hypothetical protein